LLKSAEPEGIALARPPENIFVKEILEIVGGSTTHERGAIDDVLLRRDQAARKALEGVTLKSLVQETSATILQFPYPESAACPSLV
jgi:DNA-binding IscR family transcriptional regulator